MYRTTFHGVTHEQYLDGITVEERNWMIRIRNLVQELENGSG